MTDSCCCPPQAGKEACDLTVLNLQSTSRATNACPDCGMIGKPVQGQTVKSLLLVSLREVQNTEYFFCKTQDCRVVYFSSNSMQTFRVDQVRERVYQKDPDNQDVFVCYCFRHKVGDVLGASPEPRQSILDDINTGINNGQCACDLRNPQGSCCLGNVHSLIKRMDSSSVEAVNLV